MAVGDRLKVWLGRQFLKAATLPVVPTWVVHSFLEPTFRALVAEAYQKNAAVFACVSALTFSFPEPPVQVFESEEEDSPVIKNHPLRKLLRRPNPIMGEAELMAITMAYAAIGGNAYWHKIRDRRGRVIELWPYHAGQMSAVPGGGTWIKHYEFNDGAANLTPVDAADVVHFKWPAPDPKQPWQAQPPLLAAGSEVDSDNTITAYLFSLLKNDAVPRTIIKLPAGFGGDDEVIRRTRQLWRDRYGGSNKGDVAFLEDGMSVERLGLDLQELAFDALHRVPETRIAAAFRVPAIVAGLSAGLERSTYANYGQARKAMTQDTLVPLWRIFGSEIGSDLLVEVGGQVGDVRYDTRRVAALREDDDKRWGRVTGGWKDDLLTKNEARSALGYPEKAGWDYTIKEMPQKALPAPKPDTNETMDEAVTADQQAAAVEKPAVTMDEAA